MANQRQNYHTTPLTLGTNKDETNDLLFKKHMNGHNNFSMASSDNNNFGDQVNLSDSDRAKRAAAYACAEAEIKNGMLLGIGSGTTVKFLIDWLRCKFEKGQLDKIRCVPTSFQVF